VPGGIGYRGGADDHYDVAVIAWEFRTNSGLQVLNFFLLVSAIMVAAYVSALDAITTAITAKSWLPPLPAIN
jgi:hypothetical protein